MLAKHNLCLTAAPCLWPVTLLTAFAALGHFSQVSYVVPEAPMS
jgi:hypothetical protein